MRVVVFLVLSLMIAGTIGAGCISNQNTATPAPTTAQAVPSPVVTQTMYFSLGDHYLKKSYSFQSEKDIQIEQFRVANDPWGIEFDVNSTRGDPQNTWFELRITNMDTNQTETIGYGRTNSQEHHQLYPMYYGGPYRFEMRGDGVRVYVNIAKRNP